MPCVRREVSLNDLTVSFPSKLLTCVHKAHSSSRHRHKTSCNLKVVVGNVMSSSSLSFSLQYDLTFSKWSLTCFALV